MAVKRALLLADVVDSTRLTEQLEERAAAALWTAHDRLARDLVVRWGGREIDKTDGILVLFDGVAEAVSYALGYHAAVATLGLEARAGIHAGPVALRANPEADIARGAKPTEVDAVALPVVARIMAVALAGQTLLSDDARRELGSAAKRIRSHGHWALHGIAEPIELFEVVASDVPFRAPADIAKAYRVVKQGDTWQPLRNLRHSLPAERDGFVGRRATLEAMADLLESGARLVSVVGIGGVGKTRLATRFAWLHRGDFPGGVWFCDLSHARGVDGILFAVAQGLGLQLGPADPVLHIAHAIAGRGRCLVLLDNFEQVVPCAEATLGRWIERSPWAQFVVTTREVLGIVGEHVLPLSPLDPGDAIALFLRRAEAANPSTRPVADDRAVVARLVDVLDRLPLAIELAAARVRSMTPRTLLARMSNRFEVLLSRTGRQDRQATLKATFDWSWDLLGDLEKRVLAQLSAFRGGFSLESASPVVAGEGRPPELIDVLQSLVDKSLVRALGNDRFDLLESVREYAEQHLRTEHRFIGSGPTLHADTLARHWRHFAALDAQAAVAERCADLDNLVAACRRAIEAGDGPAATGCLIGAWTALRLTGPYQAAVDLAVAVARVEALDDRRRAWVHWVAGDALDTLGRVAEARRHVEEGLRLARASDQPLCVARLLVVLGSRQGLDGELEEASSSLAEAHRLGQACADPSVQWSALLVRGRLMEYQSRFAEARDDYERALALARAGDDRRAEGGILGNLGGIHHALGAHEEAADHYRRALALLAEVGDRRWEGNGHCNLGLLHQEQGRPEAARAEFDVALATARELGHVRLANVVLCNLGILLADEGRLAEAAVHLRQAVDGAAAASDRRAEGQFSGHLALVLARLGRIDEAREVSARGEDLLVATADAMSHALLLCDRAEIEALGSHRAAADEARSRAQDIADRLGCGVESELRRRLAKIGSTPLA